LQQEDEKKTNSSIDCESDSEKERRHTLEVLTEKRRSSHQ